MYYQLVGLGGFGCMFLFLHTIRKFYISSILAVLPVLLQFIFSSAAECQLPNSLPHAIFLFLFFFSSGRMALHAQCKMSRQDLTASGVSHWVQARLYSSEILQGVELWIAGSSCIS